VSQYEIIKVLETEKKPMTSKEIASRLGIAHQNICVALKMLRRYKEVEWKEQRCSEGKKIIYIAKKWEVKD
jgi:DNA-binding transcriptional regulator GbsR (MarR family)